MDRLTVKGFEFTSNYVASKLQSWSIAECLKKLQTYEDLEEQGLLLRLPCEVGTPIYMVESECNGDVYDCHSSCEDCKCLIHYVAGISFEVSMLNEYGELDEGFYFTKEEAEAALEKMKGER